MRRKILSTSNYLFALFLFSSIILLHYAYAADNCQEWTATNDEHVAAGRAYIEDGGCDPDTYYAVGSNDSLGTSGSVATSLYSDDGAVFYAGNCPASGECQDWTATNDQHVAAARAYVEDGGCDPDTYYAIGSNDNLGTSGSTTTTLHSDDGENYYVGSCDEPGPGEITGASCTSTGTVYIYETVVVSSGTYDGQCRTYVPVGMGDGGQGEGQEPAFRVENGATLRNVIIGTPGVDGIHVYNNATLDNITWEDVGEDAMTVKSSGTYTVRNIEAYDAADKVFQINASSTLIVTNAIIHRAGKALRQNGGTTFPIDVTFDRCEIEDMNEGIFRSDSYSSTAHISNSRLHNAGDICIGNWASCTSSGITYY